MPSVDAQRQRALAGNGEAAASTPVDSGRQPLATRLSRAHLQGVLERVTEGVITSDASQTIVMANRAAMTMFGAEDLVGSPLARLVPAPFRARHARDMQAFAAAPDEPRPMGHRPDIVGIRADGSEFPLDATISVAAVDGELLYTAVLRDLTELRAAERDRWESRAKLDAALASMTDAVFISDVAGRFIEFNDAFVSFHRFASREQALARLQEYPEILEVFMPNGDPAPLEQWAVSRALRGETGTNVEYGLRRKDTGERWFGSYSFSPILGAGGEIVGSVVTGRDITAAKQAQAELQASHDSLRRLVAAQDRIQEEERKRIARELHDDLAQTLAMISLTLAMAGRALDSDPARARSLLDDASRLGSDTVASTRRIINDLRPPALEELGLLEALRVRVADFERRTGIACALDADDDSSDLSHMHPDVAACLYRVAQEALNNVAKHSGARHARVTVSDDDDGRVVVTVGDDGVGIGPDDRAKPDSFGLQGMQERVRAVGGEIEIAAKPGRGTTILATVPRIPR